MPMASMFSGGLNLGAARAGVMLATTLLAAGLIGCDAKPKPVRASAEQLRAVHGSCVEAMIRSTCMAANDKSNSAPQAETVLIAGVGRVDAKAYRQLREAGDDMCRQVQVACEADWDGNACRTGRALWSPAPAAARTP